MSIKQISFLFSLFIISLLNGCSIFRVEKEVLEVKTETSSIQNSVNKLATTFNDSSEHLSSEILENRNQLESTENAFNYKLTGIKERLEDHLDELSRKNDGNINQIKQELAAVQEELSSEIFDNKNQVESITEALEDKLDLFNTRIEYYSEEYNGKNKELTNQVKCEILALKSELNDLKSTINNRFDEINEIYQSSDQQASDIVNTGEVSAALESGIMEKTAEKPDRDIQPVNQDNKGLNTENQDATKYLNLNFIIVVTLLVLIIAVIAALMRQLNKTKDELKEDSDFKLHEIHKIIDELDTKLSRNKETSLEESLRDKTTEEPDHDLPITVCDEIQRMRNRLKHMDPNEQASKVFTQRLARLEDKLKEIGYEIVELEGNSYVEGMTVTANFVPDENLKQNERIITRVIKPQINYKNVLIQAAEIQVNQGV
jgi:hypothetical protein